MKELKGKVAVITGSASGMGRAVAERAAQEGMKVVLADVEQTALDKAESELRASGATVIGVRTDVSKPECLQELAKRALDAFGGVHLLHNNAGVSAGAAVWDTTLADWNWVMGVNLWGVIHGIWAFLPIMLQQDTECHIVNTSSMGGLTTFPFFGAPYGPSKFGVLALSETLYHELKRMGAKIGVSVLCPGQVNTRIADAKRNRPAELQNDPAWAAKVEGAPIIQAARAVEASGATRGMDPRRVAEMVFDAVKEDKFYLPTHPENMVTASMRAEEVLNERQPTSIVVYVLQGMVG